MISEIYWPPEARQNSDKSQKDIDDSYGAFQGSIKGFEIWKTNVRIISALILLSILDRSIFL